MSPELTEAYKQASAELAKQLNDMVTGQPANVACDALMNVFLQVVRATGNTAQAGEVLLTLGGTLVMSAMFEQRPAGTHVH